MGELQDEARRLLDDATPGPWRVAQVVDRISLAVEHWAVNGNPADEFECPEVADHLRENDADFIAAAPHLVESLLAALDDRDAALVAAEAEQRRLRELLAALVEVNDEPCRFDHHGYCQAHYLDEGAACRVARARAALGSVSAVPTEPAAPDALAAIVGFCESFTTHDLLTNPVAAALVEILRCCAVPLSVEEASDEQ